VEHEVNEEIKRLLWRIERQLGSYVQGRLAGSNPHFPEQHAKAIGTPIMDLIECMLDHREIKLHELDHGFGHEEPGGYLSIGLLMYITKLIENPEKQGPLENSRISKT